MYATHFFVSFLRLVTFRLFPVSSVRPVISSFSTYDTARPQTRTVRRRRTIGSGTVLLHGRRSFRGGTPGQTPRTLRACFCLRETVRLSARTTPYDPTDESAAFVSDRHGRGEGHGPMKYHRLNATGGNDTPFGNQEPQTFTARFERAPMRCAAARIIMDTRRVILSHVTTNTVVIF